MHIEPKAHNRINPVVVVQAFWWEYGSQMGCNDEEKNENEKQSFKNSL